MASLTPRSISLAEFRALVAIAFVAHAVVLFALPNMQFLFAADVMHLMRQGGHGARVNPSHPLIYVVYLVPFLAFIGLFLLKSWGRYLLLAFLALTLMGSFVLGVSISGPPETFFSSIAELADGAVLGFAFLNPPRQSRQPSNPLMQQTGETPPAAD